ncbi:acetate kinase [bacterium]|nr:acetate kinase [bacterium]
MKAVLVINSGSSSIKYRFFELETYSVIATGFVEKIGEAESRLKHGWLNKENKHEEIVETKVVPDHRQGFDWIVDVNVRTSSGEKRDLFGIGHRVVHGGEVFREPTLIDDRVIRAIKEMIPLAPLHNPANLTAIEVARERRPDVPQVAVFDTAFHQTMPPRAFHYALPQALYTEHQVRRYGFHGTSHDYVSKKAAEHLDRPLDTLNLITLHLGNGASATAVREGKSIDTSMGMTPMEGLVMGTRCGDIDPAIHFYVGRAAGMSNEELETMLNKESGLKGICGVNDMREIIRLAGSGDEHAQLAIDVYCYRIRKYIGAYFAVLGQVDALVFTGGIGENAALIRKLCCEDLDCLGIILDNQKNEASSGEVSEIQEDKSLVRILVIPTDEELEIAKQTCELILRGN